MKKKGIIAAGIVALIALSMIFGETDEEKAAREAAEASETVIEETGQIVTTEETQETEQSESAETESVAAQTEAASTDAEDGIIKMPDLVGLSAADAEQTLIDLGCKLITSLDENGDNIITLEAWEVVSQNIAPGTVIEDPYEDIELTCQLKEGETEVEVEEEIYDLAYAIGADNENRDTYYYLFDTDERTVIGFSEGANNYVYGTYEGDFESGADVTFTYDDGNGEGEYSSVWNFKYRYEGDDEYITLVDDIGEWVMRKVDLAETVELFESISDKYPSTVNGID